MRGLSLVAASGGHSSWRCAGLSLSRPLLLRSTGSRRAGSAIVAHGPSRSAACGIFPDQGSNLCPLNWQADSQPLRHQGSPSPNLMLNLFVEIIYSWMLFYVFIFLHFILLLASEKKYNVNLFFPGLLRYNWYITLCKFKVDNVLIWYTYISMSINLKSSYLTQLFYYFK